MIDIPSILALNVRIVHQQLNEMTDAFLHATVFSGSLGALEVTISDQDRARLDTVSEPEQAIVPYFSGKMIDFQPPQYRW